MVVERETLWARMDVEKEGSDLFTVFVLLFGSYSNGAELIYLLIL